MTTPKAPVLQPRDADLLDWVLAHGKGSRTEEIITSVRDLARLGVTDPTPALTLTYAQRDALRDLARLHPGGLRGDLDLTALGTVGARAYPDAAEWLSVAVALDPWDRRLQPHRVIDTWVNAGWTPAQAHDVITACATYDANPEAFDPATFTPHDVITLITAGVTSDGQVTGYRNAGVDRDGMLALANAGVTGSAAVAATELGIPRDQWVAVFAHMHKSWFPGPEAHRGWKDWSPVDTGALRDGKYTLEDLQRLRDLGWGDVSAFTLTHLSHNGGRTRAVSTPLDGEHAIILAEAGIRPGGYAAMAAALMTGKRGHPWAPPPLLGWATAKTLVPHVIALTRAGVKPASLAPYRAAGCRTVQDVLTAVDTGITPKVADVLRATYGVKGGRHEPPQIASLTDLMEAFEKYEADRYDRQG